jgi:oligopeptide/dipeptide ABC transporter ATP-binding protein
MEYPMISSSQSAVASGPEPAPVAGRSAPPPRPEEILRLRDLTVRFELRRGMLSRHKLEMTAVDGVSLSVPRGTTLGLVGATGSGKSTVAHTVMGMVQPTSGTIEVAGHDLALLKGRERVAVRRLVQVVLQDPYSSLDPRMKVRDIIAEPLTLGRNVRGAERRRIDERVAELLTLVGLRENRAERYPHQFSGGQRQRIAIARALAPSPELIVLDEPTSALDVSVRAQILTLLKRLQDELGVTYLVISHDLVTVAYLSAQVAVMHLGRIVEIGKTNALYRTPQHPYTLELLASMPGASPKFLEQPRPAGDADSMPASACKFAYRCAVRTRLENPEQCVDADPELRDVGDLHHAACHFNHEVLTMSSTLGQSERPAG